MQDQVEEDWALRAACRPVGIDVFIDHLKAPMRTDWSAAARVCAPCPVRAECLAAAIAENDVWSYRAGLTPLQLMELIDPDYVPEARDEHHRLRRCKSKIQRMRAHPGLGPSPSRHMRRTVNPADSVV